MANKAKAVLELTIDDKEYRFGLEDASKRAKDTAKDVASISKLLKAQAFIDFGREAVQALVAVGKEVVELAQRGAEVDGVQSAFDRLTSAIGSSRDAMLDTARSATKGLISDFDLMAAGNKALLLGLPVTAQSLGTMGQAAVVLGRAMKQDAAKSFDDLITALGRSSPMILDNLGLSVKVGAANEAYARSLGKSADALTDAEKKQAFYNAAMAAAAAKVAEIGGIHLTLADMVNIARVQFQNFTDQLGVAINRSPVLRAGMLEVGKAFQEAFGSNQSTLIETIVHLIEDVAIFMAKAAVVAVDVAQAIYNAWVNLNLAFSEGGSLMMQYFSYLVDGAQLATVPLQQLILDLAAVADATAKLPVIGSQYAGVGDQLRSISAGISNSFTDVRQELDLMRQGLDQSTRDTLRNAAETNKAFDSVGQVLGRIPAAMEKARASQQGLTAATADGSKTTKDAAKSDEERNRTLQKNEELMRKLGPTAKQVADEVKDLGQATKLLGGVSNLTDKQLIALVKKLDELANSGQDNEEVFKLLAEAMQEAANRGDHVAKSVGFMTKEIDKADDKLDPFQKHMEEMAEKTANVADWVGVFAGALRDLGFDADSVVGGLASISEGIAGVGASIASGDVKGAVSGLFQSVGDQFKFGKEHLGGQNKALLAGAAAFSPFALGPMAVGGLFGQSADDAMKLAAAFATALAPLKMLASEAERNKEAIEKTKEAAERYGLSVESLGPKFKAMSFDETFGQLIQDYSLLEASGANMNAVIEKMAPAYNTAVQAALAAGVAIPENMRPALEKMVEMGLLTDASGNKMTSLDGVQFGDLSDNLKSLVSEIGKLVEALKGIPNINRTITFSTVIQEAQNAVNTALAHHGGGKGFAKGTPNLDFMNFGSVSPELLHNNEAIVPQGSGHRLASEIAAAMPGSGDPAMAGTLAAIQSTLEGLPRAITRAYTHAVVMAG